MTPSARKNSQSAIAYVTDASGIASTAIETSLYCGRSRRQCAWCNIRAQGSTERRWRNSRRLSDQVCRGRPLLICRGVSFAPREERTTRIDEEETTMYASLWKAICVALVLAATASLAAQTSSSSSTQSSTDKITVTGCIQRADQSATGTTGTSGTTGDTSIKFLLTNLTSGTGGSSSTGTSGSSASSSTAATYRLDTDDSKVSPHVGHKVTIAGTVEPASGSSTSTSATSASSNANAPKLKVD